MKLLLAIIQPTKLQTVREALDRIGVERMTVCDALGFGRQRGQTESYRGMEYQVQMLRKVSLEIWVNDDFVERTIETIQRASRTGTNGHIGDGKIFLLPTEQAFSVADGTVGPGAV
ncbi:P-II family nitrogen regulator [Aureliella helgolandensis]|uniref:Nitrogen regulatory protein P-II n=1 Tax=Aureliella helgolandensis TaxID=2527968 RepID=A0A518G7W6_9BACT|nr:P-II family nitrogen regulator [Aureliella helgolandensis]QDV24688.1 Nitrogen regulatory protein P-II [Aureliella helgolandensis]